MLERAMSEYIRRHALAQPGDAVLAAVSGGADSVALLRLLAGVRGEMGLRLYAAHLDHGIRPDSGGDAGFVASVCDELRVPCTVERTDVPALARQRGCSLETAARDARWAFLRREAAVRNARAVATAHHRDDQAETVLLRLIRGGGSQGLRAMSPRDGDIIRPLLWAGHRQLEEYLAGCGQPWREDETNRDTAIPRNRVRHRVMPELAALNPRAAESIARSARLLGQDDDCLRELAGEAYAAVEEREDGLFVPESAGTLHPAVLSRVLRRAALELGAARDVSAVHIDEGMALLTPGRTGKTLSWPGGITVRREAGGLLLGPEAPYAATEPTRLRVPGITVIPGRGCFVCALLDAPPPDPAAFPAGIRHFDAALFPSGVQVRTRREGDRIEKLGAPGSRKLNDEMIDRKIGRWRRDRILLLADGDRVLWMVGYAVAHATRITPATADTLRVAYIAEPEDRSDV